MPTYGGRGYLSSVDEPDTETPDGLSALKQYRLDVLKVATTFVMEVRGKLYYFAEGDGRPEGAEQFKEPMLSILATVHRCYLTTMDYLDPRSRRKAGIADHIYDLILDNNQPITGASDDKSDLPSGNTKLVRIACDYLNQSLDWVIKYSSEDQIA